MTSNGKLDQDDVEQLRTTIAQLEHALSSRIIIEQAKGVLAERLNTGIDGAVQLLRRSARSNRTNLRDLARRVVNEPQTPQEITTTLNKH
jgi:AmiR/NasT family two-component response regulator